MRFIFIDALNVIVIVLYIDIYINKMEDKYIRYITVDDQMKGSYIIHKLTKDKMYGIDTRNVKLIKYIKYFFTYLLHI